MKLSIVQKAAIIVATLTNNERKELQAPLMGLANAKSDGSRKGAMKVLAQRLTVQEDIQVHAAIAHAELGEPTLEDLECLAEDRAARNPIPFINLPLMIGADEYEAEQAFIRHQEAN